MKDKRYQRYLSHLCREHAIAVDLIDERLHYTLPPSYTFTRRPGGVLWQRADHVTTFYTTRGGTLVQVDTLSMMDDRRYA